MYGLILDKLKYIRHMFNDTKFALPPTNQSYFPEDQSDKSPRLKTSAIFFKNKSSETKDP